ncbi:unnamed protein product [Adineta ricciae]|uniref:poly(ADP-ribose) glycohydrolase n=1 Tax=Adineta ricciae TaxID=249248 RepID=A0A815UB25_ADIRI|nr:unnamed protein product [Adineta ricciae]
MAHQGSNIQATEPAEFRGLPLDDIPNLLKQPPLLTDMQDIRDHAHTFLIKPFAYDPSKPDNEPEPIHGASVYVDKWDDDHVRLPCSSFNLTNKGSRKWSIIQNALIYLQRKCAENVASVYDIKEAIEYCNEAQFDIGCLEHLLDKVYKEDERAHFMTKVLPEMISFALNVDTICTEPPILLRIGSSRSLTFSQRQAASLLACAFFCLFPRQPHGQTYQSINFNKLFEHGPPWKLEKLKCLLHYFWRVTHNMPKGVLTLRRFALPNQWIPSWMESQTPVCSLHVNKNTTIEDMPGLLQIDFANEFIGGGVMGDGIVQEEIRFTICPEMLISLLVGEVMQTNECIFLFGCEQYVSYSGYADTFKAKADFVDNTDRDNWGRRLCHVVAMDAICFSNPCDQYIRACIDRELNKAFTCFRLPRSYEQRVYGIATGNWGCGAFRGDKELKAIIQIMAASEAHRPLAYATWHDQNLMDSLWTVYECLLRQRATVRDIYKCLLEYIARRPQLSLFDFIRTTPISSLQIKP